jgi:hypothetical protein
MAKNKRMGGPTVKPPSAMDTAAARAAGVTRAAPMKETQRHPVVGKGKATRKA